MAMHAYEGLSDDVLDQSHTTTTGERYTLRCNEALKMEMPYLGENTPSTNAQGWERSKKSYFTNLQQNHPEMFSKKNMARLKEGVSPVVDSKMIAHNPQFAQYRNQVLVHHHVGGDGEVIAVPQNAHKGPGEIHNAEKKAGITAKCESESKQYGAYIKTHPEAKGYTASQLRASMAQSNVAGQEKVAKSTATPTKTASAATKSSQAKSRSAVVSATPTKTASAPTKSSQAKSRSAVVSSAKASSATQASSAGRAASVGNATGAGRGASKGASSSAGQGTGTGQGR